MTIRQADLSDALSIATVHVRSWQAAYPGQVPQTYLDSLTPEVRLPAWEQALAAATWPRRATLVMTREPDGDVLGFVSFGPTADDDADPDIVAEVHTLYVDPDAMGTGIGDRLLAAALEALRGAGYRDVTLWALHTNARARAFYERRGWTLDGVTKLHDWDAFVATDVRYRITLS